jgi:mRNA-degrading endonuclease RelE of RelBE toxin-antitoxin system
MYKIRIKKQAEKKLQKMPISIQDTFFQLVDDLKKTGPLQPGWSNFSKLGDNKYHCHLSYKWVACLRSEKNSLIIEVYYAGSRENAPY